MTPHQGPLSSCAAPAPGTTWPTGSSSTDDGYCGWVCDAPAAAPRACSPIEVVAALGADHRNAVATMTDDACQALRERAFSTPDESRASRLRRAAQLLRAARLEASAFAAWPAQGSSAPTVATTAANASAAKASSTGTPTTRPHDASTPIVSATPTTRQAPAATSCGRGAPRPPVGRRAARRPRRSGRAAASPKSAASDGTRISAPSPSETSDRDERRAARRGVCATVRPGQELRPLGEAPAGDDRGDGEAPPMTRARLVAARRARRRPCRRRRAPRRPPRRARGRGSGRRTAGCASAWTTTRPASASGAGDDGHGRARGARKPRSDARARRARAASAAR